jgi:hypothetical protein
MHLLATIAHFRCSTYGLEVTPRESKPWAVRSGSSPGQARLELARSHVCRRQPQASFVWPPEYHTLFFLPFSEKRVAQIMCELLVIASNLPPPPIYPPLHSRRIDKQSWRGKNCGVFNEIDLTGDEINQIRKGDTIIRKRMKKEETFKW